VTGSAAASMVKPASTDLLNRAWGDASHKIVCPREGCERLFHILEGLLFKIENTYLGFPISVSDFLCFTPVFKRFEIISISRSAAHDKREGDTSVTVVTSAERKKRA
jgi:hypothetical protein